MSKYFRVSISGTGPSGAETYWLTTDATETGKPCKVAIPEAANLIEGSTANTSRASDGTPSTERPLIEGKGINFDIQAANVNTDLYGDLVAFLAFNEAAHTSFQVTGSGEPGSFDVQAVKYYDGSGSPVTWDGFTSGNIKSLRIRLITTAIN